jgi:hypothetical protein
VYLAGPRQKPHSGLAVARVTRLQALNLVVLDQLQSYLLLIGGVFISHGEDLIAGPDKFLGVAVAFQTPAHFERVFLIRERHLVNAAVAGFATHALFHVDAVIEVNKIGKIVNADPGNRLIGTVAGANHIQLRTVGPDLRVTIHTGLGRRDVGEPGVFDGGVAIAAIDTHGADVVRMAELDGLDASHALIGCVRGIGAQFKKRAADTKECEDSDYDPYSGVTV